MIVAVFSEVQTNVHLTVSEVMAVNTCRVRACIPRLNANILHTAHTVTHSYDILPLAQARPMMLSIYTSKGNVCHNLLQAKLTAYHLTSSFSLVPRPEEEEVKGLVSHMRLIFSTC